MANQDIERDSGREGQEADWARQVRQNWQRGPYRDYGWESGESALPEFRDPSVHRMPYDDEDQEQYREPRGSQRANFRRAYDYQNANRLPTGEMPTQRGYGSGYAREEWWNVPGPHRGRGPRGYQRSDARICDDVCDRLTRHGQIDPTDVNVEVQNGEVTLSGTVASRRMKRMAEDVAESVTGVKDVQNQLHIRKREQDLPAGQAQGSGRQALE